MRLGQVRRHLSDSRGDKEHVNVSCLLHLGSWFSSCLTVRALEARAVALCPSVRVYVCTPPLASRRRCACALRRTVCWVINRRGGKKECGASARPIIPLRVRRALDAALSRSVWRVAQICCASRETACRSPTLNGSRVGTPVDSLMIYIGRQT